MADQDLITGYMLDQRPRETHREPDVDLVKWTGLKKTLHAAGAQSGYSDAYIVYSNRDRR